MLSGLSVSRQHPARSEHGRPPTGPDARRSFPAAPDRAVWADTMWVSMQPSTGAGDARYQRPGGAEATLVSLKVDITALKIDSARLNSTRLNLTVSAKLRRYFAPAFDN